MAEGRLVELVFRGDARSVTRAYSEIAAGSDKTAATVRRNAARQDAAMRKSATAMGAVGRSMMVAGAGIGALGYLGIKSSLQFQTAMTRIQTQAGASSKEVTRMTKAINQFVASGKSSATTTELAAGLYNIESVGMRGAKAFEALKLSEEASAISGANLTDVTRAFAGAATASHVPIAGLTSLMAMMNATVGSGMITFQDLTTGLSHGIIPAFQSVGLHAKDAMAAIALLTREGFGASSVGSTLPTALHYLSHPSTAAAGLLSQIGLQPGKLSADFYKPNGLLTALKDLESHMSNLSRQGKSDLLQSILPGGRGRILLGLIDQLDEYQKLLGKVGVGTGDLTKKVDAYNKTPAAQFHRAWAVINKDLQDFGKAILPLVTAILPKLVSVINAIANAFKGLPSWARSGVGWLAAGLLIGGATFAALSKFIGMLLDIKKAYIAIKAAAFGATAAETGAAGAGTGAAAAGAGAAARGLLEKVAPVAAGYLAYKHSRNLGHSIQSGNVGSSAAKGGLLGAAAGGLAGLLSGGPPGAILGAMLGGGAGGAGAGALSALLFGSGGIFGGRSSAIPRGASGRGHLPTAGAHGGLVTASGIQRFQYGGAVGTDNIPAWLSAGEGVLSRVGLSGIGGPQGLAALNAGKGSGNFTIEQAPVNIYLDGRLVAKSVLRATLNKAARGPSSLSGGSLVAARPSSTQ